MRWKLRRAIELVGHAACRRHSYGALRNRVTAWEQVEWARFTGRATNPGAVRGGKVLPDSFANNDDRRARFLREAQILATLNHPYIAAIYGWEDSWGNPALVMELVEGKPLSAHISRHGIVLPKALKYATQIATGLEAAHRAGIIHRDLKPGNVMITPADDVKLLDFGLAKLSEPAVTDASAATRTMATLTEEGKILGTVAYMSPEQAQGQPVDARSDIFVFGAVLYEMLTGQQAFQRGNTASSLPRSCATIPSPSATLERPVFHTMSRKFCGAACARTLRAGSKRRRICEWPSTNCRRNYRLGS